MKVLFPLSGSRVAIVGCCWAVLVVAWVLVTEPYGSRLSDSEWGQFLKMLLVPPAAAAILNFLVDLFINGEKQDEN